MNKFERAKQEKDGLDVFPALMRAAEVGWESLDDNDVMRLKWYGLYAHNTKDGHFMLRTKVVQGILTADQAEVMASITDDFARGIIDCTTRQCFQNHWLKLDEAPEAAALLELAVSWYPQDAALRPALVAPRFSTAWRGFQLSGAPGAPLP